MRTTIQIDDELLAEVEAVAALRGCSATELIERAVRDSLPAHRPSARRERVALPVFHGGGVRPGVDLDNSAALLDLMEEGDSSS